LGTAFGDRFSLRSKDGPATVGPMSGTPSATSRLCRSRSAGTARIAGSPPPASFIAWFLGHAMWAEPSVSFEPIRSQSTQRTRTRCRIPGSGMDAASASTASRSPGESWRHDAIVT
jgi:hypothetical protein